MKDDERQASSDCLRCNATALRKATRRVSQLYDEVLASSGLKTTQRAILAEIRRSGPTTIGALADKLVMDPGALAHTLKPLKRDGFISISVDPDDRRNRLVGLSRQGKAKLVESDTLWLRAQAGFESAFGKVETVALRQAMRILASDGFVTRFQEHLGSAGRRHA
jgi:DNA-binding MarR family transcriptional regulator